MVDHGTTEIYIPSATSLSVKHCRLPDLPRSYPRASHSQDKFMVCGGYNGSSLEQTHNESKNCCTYNPDQWEWQESASWEPSPDTGLPPPRQEMS